MGILLSKPSEMLRVNIAFLPADKERVLRVLQEAGVVDVEPVEAEKVLKEYERLVSLRDRINSILQKARKLLIDVSITGVELESLDLGRIEEHVEELQSEITLLEERARLLRQQADALKTYLTAISPLPDSLEAVETYYVGKHVSSILFTGKPEAINELIARIPALRVSHLYSGEDYSSLIAYVPTCDLNQVFSTASSLGIWFPSKELVEIIQAGRDIGSLKQGLMQKISELETEASRIEGEIIEKVKSNSETLGKYLLFVENLMERYHVSGLTTNLKHLSALTGWIPRESIRKLNDAVTASNIPVFIEYREPIRGNESPPTKFNNKGFTRYFQVITRLYGVPGYWEWDPTPIVAYSFAFFFAIMNSDVGYALAGLLAILLFLDKLVENPDSPLYREFKGVLIVSNILSLILGLLSGSIFGDLLSSLLGINVPAVLTVFSKPVDFIKLALVIGLIHINIAHALATVKFLREGRRGDFLNEVGLFVSELFGIPYILRVFFKYDVPVLAAMPTNVLLYGSIAGLALIIAGNYLSMRGLGFLMWIFQVTGILGDVMSYVRLAGVSLASFYMAVSFNIMVKLVANGLSSILPGIGGIVIASIASIPLLFIIHLVVMVLGELGAFVHSLRLCMLEFLMKFYDGAGREYRPFSIVASRRIIVSA